MPVTGGRHATSQELQLAHLSSKEAGPMKIGQLGLYNMHLRHFSRSARSETNTMHFMYKSPAWSRKGSSFKLNPLGANKAFPPAPPCKDPQLHWSRKKIPLFAM